VHIRERIANIARLLWERLYSGSETDHHHAAAVPADGSLLRARVDPATGSLFLQRVVDPGFGSDFASWSYQATVSTSAGICVASEGANVVVLYVDTDDRTVKCIESSNYGASFGSPTTVLTAGSAVGSMASALKSDGTALLIYSAGATIYAVKRSGGSWGSPAAWTNSVASDSGLACCHSIDFDVAVAGSDASGAAKLWTAVYGDGFSQPLDTWSALKEIARADSGSSMQFRAPFLDRADCHRLFFIEKYSGSQAYSRPLWSNLSLLGDFTTHSWHEPVPFDLSSEYGVAIAHATSYAWLSTPSGVWRAALETPALEVTEDVLELRMECEPFDGRLRIVLRNDGGRYSDLSSGVIKRGSQVDVSPGFFTGNGPEVSSGLSYWIEGWEHGSGGGASTLTLFARDGWSLVEGWRARREYAWAAGQSNVYQILSFILSRAGLQYDCRSSSLALTSLRPAFAIHPAEDGRTAVRRLLAMVPDVILMSGEDALGVDPLAGEDSAYAYGDDHAILSGRYATRTPDYNRVQVFGRGVMLDSLDWSSVTDIYDRLLQVHDVNLTTADALQARADALKREAEMASLAGEIVAPVNCGQELYDVVTVTDAGAGLDAARRRVLGISLRYSRRKDPAYAMRLALGAP
jgi:hypothetical protein